MSRRPFQTHSGNLCLATVLLQTIHSHSLTQTLQQRVPVSITRKVPALQLLLQLCYRHILQVFQQELLFQAQQNECAELLTNKVATELPST